MEASVTQKDDTLQEASEVSQTFFVAPDADDVRGDGSDERAFVYIEAQAVDRLTAPWLSLGKRTSPRPLTRGHQSGEQAEPGREAVVPMT